MPTRPGEVLIQSDGTPWRPLVHVEDISAAFLSVLEAPRELVHDEAFNVGASSENYRIRDLAEIVEEVVPGARARSRPGAGRTSAPIRSTARRSPACCPRSSRAGRSAAASSSSATPTPATVLTFDEFTGTRYLRINRVRELQEAGRLDDELRWRLPVGAG